MPKSTATGCQGCGLFMEMAVSSSPEPSGVVAALKFTVIAVLAPCLAGLPEVRKQRLEEHEFVASRGLILMPCINCPSWLACFLLHMPILTFVHAGRFPVHLQSSCPLEEGSLQQRLSASHRYLQLLKRWAARSQWTVLSDFASITPLFLVRPSSRIS